MMECYNKWLKAVGHRSVAPEFKPDQTMLEWCFILHLITVNSPVAYLAYLVY